MKYEITPAAMSLIGTFDERQKKNIMNSINQLTQKGNLTDIMKNPQFKKIRGRNDLYSLRVNNSIRVLVASDNVDTLNIVDIVDVSSMTVNPRFKKEGLSRTITGGIRGLNRNKVRMKRNSLTKLFSRFSKGK